MFSTEAIYQESYLTIPRSVFCDENLSLEAMVLYSFLLDRSKLSERNRLQDENGIFVFCTIEEAAKLLRAGRSKVMQVFEELVEKQYITRLRQGHRKANKYYVTLPLEVRHSDVCDSDPLKSEIQTGEVCKTDPSNNKPINNDLSNKETSESSPVLPSSERIRSLSFDEQLRWLRARAQIDYFRRKAAGEDVQKLDKEVERVLKTKDPLIRGGP